MTILVPSKGGKRRLWHIHDGSRNESLRTFYLSHLPYLPFTNDINIIVCLHSIICLNYYLNLSHRTLYKVS